MSDASHVTHDYNGRSRRTVADVSNSILFSWRMSYSNSFPRPCCASWCQDQAVPSEIACRKIFLAAHWQMHSRSACLRGMSSSMARSALRLGAQSVRAFRDFITGHNRCRALSNGRRQHGWVSSCKVLLAVDRRWCHGFMLSPGGPPFEGNSLQVRSMTPLLESANLRSVVEREDSRLSTAGEGEEVALCGPQGVIMSRRFGRE